MTDLTPFLRTDYKAVDKHDGLHSVMGWLSGDTDKLPIITDEGKAFGVVNERALMSRSLDGKAKVEQYSLVTRALPDTASWDQIARRMGELRAAHLPIENAKGKLTGYLSAIDVARHNGASAKTARDLCVPVTMLREDATMGEALHAFGKEYVDHLPVLDAHGRIRGVVHRRNVYTLGQNAGDKGRMDNMGDKQHPLRDRVDGFAEEVAAELPANASFEAVATALDAWGYAIVRDGERILGVVTAETLLRAS
jgi:CBS domain-containing protein